MLLILQQWNAHSMKLDFCLRKNSTFQSMILFVFIFRDCFLQNFTAKMISTMERYASMLINLQVDISTTEYLLSLEGE